MKGIARPALPSGWVADGVEVYCLGCRRERAGEAGVLELADDAPVDERQKKAHHARIEFEIKRDPDRPDNQIAKACRTSTPAVRKARERIGVPRPPLQHGARS